MLSYFYIFIFTVFSDANWSRMYYVSFKKYFYANSKYIYIYILHFLTF